VSNASRLARLRDRAAPSAPHLALLSAAEAAVAAFDSRVERVLDDCFGAAALPGAALLSLRVEAAEAMRAQRRLWAHIDAGAAEAAAASAAKAKGGNKRKQEEALAALAERCQALRRSLGE